MTTMIFKRDYNINLDVLDTCTKHIKNSRLGLIIKRLSNSIRADGMLPDRMDEHDSFFIPKNDDEKTLWDNLRASAKIQIKSIITGRINGSKGGRPIKKTPSPAQPAIKQLIVKEENKVKAHNALEIFGNSFKATDAVVGVFDRPDGTTREGIRIKNPRLMAFVRQRFDKEILNKVSDWAIDHNQRGHTYNATSLLRLLCKFQRDVEPTINFNHVQIEYLNFKFGE